MPPKRITQKPTPKNNQIEEKLNTIYQDDRGELPNLGKITRKKHSLILRAFVGLLFLSTIVAGAVWAGFFFLDAKTTPTNNDMELLAEAPEQTAIGSDITYTIDYKPLNASVIQKARIRVHYPNGFQVSSTVPSAANADSTIWEWENLEKKQEGQIKITGKLFGNPEQEQSLRIFLYYQPQSFQSEFQQVTSVTTKTLGSPIQLSVEGPDSIISGKETDYTLVVTNVHEEILDGLVLQLPKEETELIALNEDGIEGLENGEKIIESAQGLFLPDLKPEEQWRIPFTIAFEDKREAKKNTLRFYIYKEIDTHQFILSEVEKEIAIERNEFTIQLLANGKDKEVNSKPGEFLTFSVFYKNNGTQDLKDVKVSAFVDAPSSDKRSIFNWSELIELSDAPVVGEQINGDTRRGIITWSQDDVSDLKFVEAGEQGILNFQLPVKSDSEILDNYDSFQATARASAEFDVDGEETAVSSNAIDIFLNSDTEFITELKQKDEEGFYTMLWKIDNTWHPIKDIKISTVLFGDIEWAGPDQTPAGNMSFNEKTGAVEWKIDEMPIEAGVLALNFKFKIKSVNPTQTALTDKIEFNATDSITNKNIFIEHVEVPMP